MRRREWLFVAIALFSLGVAACGSPANEGQSAQGTGDSAQSDGEEFVLTYSDPFTVGRISLADTSEWFMQEVERRTDGRVTFEAHWGGSLVPATDALAALQDGRVDSAYISHVYWPGDFPLWEVAGLPFISRDGIAMVRTMNDLYRDDETFQSEFDRNRVHILLFQATDVGALYTVKPAEKPADLSGRRMRSVGVAAKAIEEVGAEPVALPPGEVFEALERGTIDGVGPLILDGSLDFGVQDAAKHVIEPGIGTYASTAIGISQDKWEQLPEDLQAIMDEVAQEYYESEAPRILEEAAARACEAYREEGAEFHRFSEADIEEWAGQVRDDTVSAWRSQAEGHQSADEAEAFLTAYTQAFDDHAEGSEFIDGVTRCLEAEE